MAGRCFYEKSTIFETTYFSGPPFCEFLLKQNNRSRYWGYSHSIFTGKTPLKIIKKNFLVFWVFEYMSEKSQGQKVFF